MFQLKNLPDSPDDDGKRGPHDRHPQDKRTTDRFHIAQIERTQGRGPEPHRAADCHGHTAGT